MPRNHKADIPIIDRLADRSKFNVFNGCLEWFGAVDQWGYGIINVNYKVHRTHRLNFIEHFGPIKEGLNVCHKCDNPKCINPSHLFLGTQKDNMQDCAKKNRIFAPIGEDSPHAVFTIEDILQIRADPRRCYIIAKDYETSSSQIMGIKNGTRWGHIPKSFTILPKPNKGENNGGAKLNEKQVIAILSDDRSKIDIAKEYGVSPRAIYDIKSGRKWAYLSKEKVS